jgi:hypothetical protein
MTAFRLSDDADLQPVSQNVRIKVRAGSFTGPVLKYSGCPLPLGAPNVGDSVLVHDRPRRVIERVIPYDVGEKKEIVLVVDAQPGDIELLDI